MRSEPPQRLRQFERLTFDLTHTLVLLLYAGAAVFLIGASWPAGQMRSLLDLPSPELQYLILVGAGAALGTTLVALTGLLETRGRRAPLALLTETLRPLIAAVLGMAFYTVVRGALLRPDPPSVACLNPYGVVGAAVIIGIFTGPVLKQIAAITQVLSGQESQLNQQLDRMATAMGVTTLDNYSGFVCAAIRDASTGREVRLTEDHMEVAPDTPYDMIVWFQNDQPERMAGVVATDIQVSGGADTDVVEFAVGPESDAVQLRPRTQTLTFASGARSGDAAFRFRSPEKAGTFEVWIEVTQKNRLIHVLQSTFEVPTQPS